MRTHRKLSFVLCWCAVDKLGRDGVSFVVFCHCSVSHLSRRTVWRKHCDERTMENQDAHVCLNIVSWGVSLSWLCKCLTNCKTIPLLIWRPAAFLFCCMSTRLWGSRSMLWVPLLVDATSEGDQRDTEITSQCDQMEIDTRLTRNSNGGETE